VTFIGKVLFKTFIRKKRRKKICLLKIAQQISVEGKRTKREREREKKDEEEKWKNFVLKVT
jgi:hypothetical protein